jgi:hypothetical protein
METTPCNHALPGGNPPHQKQLVCDRSQPHATHAEGQVSLHTREVPGSIPGAPTRPPRPRENGLVTRFSMCDQCSVCDPVLVPVLVRDPCRRRERALPPRNRRHSARSPGRARRLSCRLEQGARANFVAEGAAIALFASSRRSSRRHRGACSRPRTCSRLRR